MPNLMKIKDALNIISLKLMQDGIELPHRRNSNKGKHDYTLIIANHVRRRNGELPLVSWRYAGKYIQRAAGYDDLKAPPRKRRVKVPYTPPLPPNTDPASSVDFLTTSAWLVVRYRVLKQRKAMCECCGRTRKDGVTINVDHIKPRKTHPHLALDPNNLQVLCNECNKGKGNWDDTDWRAA